MPDYLVTEVTEHLPDIVKRLNNSKTKKQLLTDFKHLLEGITIVPEKDIQKTFIAEAEKIAMDIDIDEDDMHFIALHLQIRHKIWTMDNRLKNGFTAKGYGHFFITEEKMIASTYKKKLPNS